MSADQDPKQYPLMEPSPPLAALLHELERLQSREERAIVAIDGRCASGKTTLAAYVEKRLGVPVVHMDHFFLRPEQQSPARYAQPGGNVDHERFLAEVLTPLEEGRAPAYRPYCCQTGRLGEPIALKPSPVVLVEGSYSCHPALWDHYRRRVFLTVEPEEQLRRIADRDGPERLRTFQERWIPLEERYFSAYKVEDRCDYRLEL